jgi:hypothetical protein
MNDFTKEELEWLQEISVRVADLEVKNLDLNYHRQRQIDENREVHKSLNEIRERLDKFENPNKACDFCRCLGIQSKVATCPNCNNIDMVNCS